MRKIFNIPTSVWSAALLSLAMVSCSEDTMDEINADNNHTTDVTGKFIICDVLTSTAVSNSGGDMSTYTSIYIEHEAGTDNQTLRAETREGEPSASSTFNNVWGNMYGTLMDAKIVADKGEFTELDDLLAATGKIMAAYNLALITDMFGDTPWSQACDFANYMTPELDAQEDIYNDIFTLLDEAIAHLETAPSNTLFAYDFLYAGDYSKWLKFAYGLKARYTMRLLYRSSDVDADMADVLSYVENSFASAADEAAFNIYDATNLNPLFDYQWSRDGIGSSQSMNDKLTERNDPRANRVYYDGGYWNHQVGDEVVLAENGVADGGTYYYSYSAFCFAQTASTMLLSYHELMFLKAEALCRLDRTAEAEVALADAVGAAFVNFENSISAAMVAPSVVGYGGLGDGYADVYPAITSDDVTAYLEGDVATLFAANPLKEVMVQKYIAFWGASGEATEAYNDVRRLMALGEGDFIELQHVNPNKFPLRCPYGGDDTTTNPNIYAAYGDGTYVYSENVWWAGGTR